MKTKIEEILEIISQPIDASAIEELLIQYINQFNKQKDFEEIFGTGFNAEYEGKTIVTDLINFSIENNLTKFLCAVLEKYPELAEYTQKTDEFDEIMYDTLAHMVAKKEMKDVCFKILEVAPYMVYKRNFNEQSFVSICAENEMEDVCIQALHIEPKLAEEQFGSLNQTIGHIAAEHSMEIVVLKALSANPKSACVTDTSGKTYLHYAAENMLGAACLRSLELCPEAAKIQCNMMKETFLHVAASFGKNEEMENVLIKALETNPELAKIGNFLGETFLHIAASNKLEKVLIKALEVAPELAEIKNEDGNTFLHIAAEEGMEKVLLKALKTAQNAIEIKNDEGKTCMDIYKELHKEDQTKTSHHTTNNHEKN